MSDLPYIATAGLAAVGLLVLRLQQPRSAGAATEKPAASAPMPPRPGPQYVPVYDFNDLVTKTGVAGRLSKIQQKLGFAPDNYARDVLPLLQKFAEFVQMLPASESHHHAQPGGLLVHLVECAEYALHFRDSYKLPIGASTEEQMRLAARYSYAVLIAALLHDIGKPVADVTVLAVDVHGAAPRPWVSLAGALREQGMVWYAVDFPNKRDYEAHKRLPVILLQRFVPDAAITWLGECKPLLQELMDYLSGDRTGGSIAEIVTKADQKSVADNLLMGPRTRFASARSVPLIERLMEALRGVLAAGGVTLNRAGATGYSDGESLWCVAGSIAKSVREYLAQNETREAGAAGIPDDNNRLFDTWQEYGALIPNGQGGAIWNVKIKIGEWEQGFTVLRFPLTKLYPKPDLYPQALGLNAVSVVEAAAERASAAPAPAKAPPARPVRDVVAERDAEFEQAAPPAVASAVATDTELADQVEHAAAHESTPAPMTVPAAAQEPAPDLPAPADIDDGYPSFEEDPPAAVSAIAPAAADYLDDTESAHAFAPAQEADVPATVQAPIKPKDRRSKQSSASVVGRSNAPKERPNAERFMAWIQQGIGNGELLYNESSACIHFVPEGMMLLSPKAFQEYARLCPNAIELEVDKPTEPWKMVQRDFQRSIYPLKGEGGTFLHYYTVSGPAGKRLAGLLVPEPGRFFNPVPASNPLIQSKKKSEP